MAEQEVDLSHIHWTSPEWIYHLPTRSLSTPDEALDYFAISPFWDVKSNNHALRTQRRVFDPLYGAAQERQDLLSFRGGFEYVVSHSRAPDLYLIQRREVQPDGSRKDTDGMFFILQGKVYSAPSLFDILDTRLRNANHLLVESFARLSESRPPANPRVPASWRSLPPVTSASKQATSARPTAPPTPSGRQDSLDPAPTADVASDTLDVQMDYLLFNALQASRSKIGQLGKRAGDQMGALPGGADLAAKDIARIGVGGHDKSTAQGSTLGGLSPTPLIASQRLHSSSGRTPSGLGIEPVSSPMSFS